MRLRITPLLSLLILFLPYFSAAWTGPTGTAPASNVAAPLNVGTVDQVKNANIGVNGIAIFGNAILSGGFNYLNFGATAGTSGYGMRDNGGTLEFKNNGGNWASLQSTVSALIGNSGQWATSGSSIYYNSGNVGIGTASPATKLDVAGSMRVGNGGETCAAGTAGVIRYNNSSTMLEYCNGAAWSTF